MDKKDMVIVEGDIQLDEADLFISADDLKAQVNETQANQARFIIAFDATGSMGSYWSSAKEALGRTIEEISNRTGNKVSVQMVAYRDDNDAPRDLESSVFTSNANILKEFISKQHCFGGDDYEEAIDTCLNHIIKERPSRSIILGDAPAHTNIQGRDGYSQAKELGGYSSPVFTLRCHERRDLVDNFTTISKLSGGKSFALPSIGDMVDIIATIIASDKKLLRHCAGLLPYEPKGEAAKQIAKEL
jgi:hypothetical protein